mgnify:CR=1 FL=1
MTNKDLLIKKYKKPKDYKLGKTNIEFSKSKLYAKHSREDFNFIRYKLINNKKSSMYYKNEYKKISENENYVYVVFEKITGVFFCNSSKLSYDLKIAEGVS